MYSPSRPLPSPPYAHAHTHTQSLKSRMLRQASIGEAQTFVLPAHTPSQHTREGAPKDLQVSSALACPLPLPLSTCLIEVRACRGCLRVLCSAVSSCCCDSTAHTYTHTRREVGEMHGRRHSVREELCASEQARLSAYMRHLAGEGRRRREGNGWESDRQRTRNIWQRQRATGGRADTSRDREKMGR